MLKKKLKRMICGKKHLLSCLLKNNTQEKQIPHFYLCSKLHYHFCTFFSSVCAGMMKYSIFRVRLGWLVVVRNEISFLEYLSELKADRFVSLKTVFEQLH